MAKNKKSSGLADRVRQKKKGDIAKKKVLNPFEVHINKQKFRIIGQKTKSDRGLPGVARGKANKKRQETLGTEYKLLNKTNTFLDRRIGEKGDSLTGEDKVIARFAAERIKQHKINTGKQSIFNLADDEVLTHRGQTLEEIEKFDDPRSSGDEDEDDGRKKYGGLRDKFVSEGHFGGGLLSKTESKDGANSHKDLIALLISESKKRKVEKQKMREQTLDLTQKLDTDWKDLQPFIARKSKTDEDESAIDKLLRVNDRRNEDYDKVTRELRFESRGTPSDGLKSEEEMAKKNKEKLDQLEKDRLARMHGTYVPTTSNKHKSADDLDDNFDVDTEPNYMISYDADGNPLVPEHILKENTFSDKRKTQILDSDDEDEENLVEDESDSEENLPSAAKKRKKSSDENDKESDQEQETESEEDDSDDDSTDSLKDLKESDDSYSEEDTTQENTHKVIVKQEQGREKKQKSIEMTQKVTEKADLKDSDISIDSEDTSQKSQEVIKKLKQATEKKQKLTQKVTKMTQKVTELTDLNKSEISDSEEETLQKVIEKPTQKATNKQRSEVAERVADHTELKTEKMLRIDAIENDSDEDSIASLKVLKESSESDDEEIENITENKGNIAIRPSQELLDASKRINIDFTKMRDVKLEIDEDIKKKIKEDLLARKEIMEKASRELPYTYEMPESYEDLQKLLSGKLPEYQGIILERLIKCFHPSLGATNKDKLSIIFAYLFQYVNDLFSDITLGENIVNSFRVFDKISPFLYDLSDMNIMCTKRALTEVLREKREDFNNNKKIVPGLDTLIFLKLVSLLFPTSDFRHPVVTPSLVFMSDILTYSKYKNRSDIARGFFVMALILEYSVLSKRFLPSAINFLRGMLYMCANTTILNPIKVVPPFKKHSPTSKLLQLQSDCSETALTSTQITAKDLITEEIDDDFRLRSFLTSLRMFKEMFENCNEIQSQEILFHTHVELLKRIDLELYPMSVREEFVKTLDSIKATLETKTYTLLAPEKKKPKALKLYEPDFQDVFTGRVSKKVSREQTEHEKLVFRYKRETKGALREIRRDRAYIASIQIKKKIESDNIRKAKVKEIYKDAAIQHGELNELKRKSKK